MYRQEGFFCEECQGSRGPLVLEVYSLDSLASLGGGEGRCAMFKSPKEELYKNISSLPFFGEPLNTFHIYLKILQPSFQSSRA